MNQTSAELELNTVLERSHENILITDGAGQVLKASASCAAIYGLSLAQLVGASVFELELQGILKPSITVKVLESQQEEQVMQCTRSGRTVMAKAYPVFNDAGQLYRVVSFSQDLTDLHLLQQEYEWLQQKLVNQNKGRSDEVIHVAGLCIKSPAVREIYGLLERISSSDVSILFLGESGVGKTAFAQLVHRLGERHNGPFVELNCSTIPDSLFESEMFGYAPGAFTGAAKQGKAGLIEQAHQGTLFLDEVGELPLAMQAKLLKVLQDGKVTRIGGSEANTFDFRLLAATNQDLQQKVDTGEFRLDLYYRLNVVPVTIPPLRQRMEDIPDLINHILQHLNQRYGLNKSLAPEARQQLLEQPWLGNVRELENTLERCYVTSEGKLIQLYSNTVVTDTVPTPLVALEEGTNPRPQSLKAALDQLEKQLLMEAQQHCKGTYEIARYLGLSQPTVFRKLKKHGL